MTGLVHVARVGPGATLPAVATLLSRVSLLGSVDTLSCCHAARTIRATSSVVLPLFSLFSFVVLLVSDAAEANAGSVGPI